MKPQDVPKLLGEVGPVLGGEQLVISVAAGVPIRAIQRALPGPTPVIRVMPNTPALVRAGMAVLALGEHARPRDEELATKIFSAVGSGGHASRGLSRCGHRAVRQRSCLCGAVHRGIDRRRRARGSRP